MDTSIEFLDVQPAVATRAHRHSTAGCEVCFWVSEQRAEEHGAFEGHPRVPRIGQYDDKRAPLDSLELRGTG
jgi:hypothetical protein